jgi:arginase family enzyme
MRQDRKQIFGVALDVADDPWSLQLKWASMMATEKDGDSLYFDPYDAVTDNKLKWPYVEFGGKFPIPSWLGPRPLPSDRHLISAKNMQQFVAHGGLLETMKQLQDFIEKNIFPAIPIMVGVDHSATRGAISALTKRYGPEMVSAVVLDRHFDAIPLSLRIDRSINATSDIGTNTSPLHFNITEIDQYCCGNFWAYLMDSGIVLPENLLFVGVADYPKQETDHKWKRFRESYLSFEEKGCNFFPLWQFSDGYIDPLTKFIHERVKTPYVYVSLDLDVESYCCIHAARYMDGPGISRQNILDIAGIIAGGCRDNSFMLVGFDIMEFNMHFLGIKSADGVEDFTLPLVQDFIKTLTIDSSKRPR